MSATIQDYRGKAVNKTDQVSALMEFPFYLEVRGVQTAKTATTAKNKKIADKFKERK